MELVKRKINTTEQLDPFKKSKTAFLTPPCDKINSLSDKPYYFNEWDFSVNTAIGIHKANNLIVSFNTVPTELVNGVQDALYHMYHFKKSMESQLPTSSWTDIKKIGLVKISTCLSGTNWSALDNKREFKSFIRSLKSKYFTYHQLTPVISACNYLTASGLIKTYVDASKIYEQASTPKNTQQHIALPPKMFQALLNEALSVVNKYHKHRHTISEIMGKAYEIKKRGDAGEIISSKIPHRSMKPSAIEARITRAIQSIEHNVPDFKPGLKGSKLSEILTSCIIVVLAFSGTRIGEALSFNKSNCKTIKVNDRNIVVLQGETTKGSDGTPRFATWQSHPIALKALELADDMMETSRKFYEQKINKYESDGTISYEIISHMRMQLQSAFISPSIYEQKSMNFTFITNVNKRIKKFLIGLQYKHTQDDVDTFDLLNPSREGQLIVGRPFNIISPHTFRRTFAVFFVRYGFGSAQGIKFQYKHENLNMSDYYANNAVLAKMNDLLLDTDLLDELKEAGIELGVEIYDEIFNKSEHLSGKQGEAIQRDKFEKLKEGESILMTQEEIESHIRAGEFTIVQLPSGAYCTNSSCDRICGTLSFRAEIKECSYKIVTDQGANKIARQRQRLIDKFQVLNTGDKLKSSILAGIKNKIQIDELTLVKHDIDFTPFTEDIIALKGIA